jgi:hypothetical protein
MQASLVAANKLAATRLAEKTNSDRVSEKATKLAEACQLKWESVCKEKQVVEKEKMDAQEETKKYKGLLTKRIQAVGTFGRITCPVIHSDLRIIGQGSGREHRKA